VSLDAMPWNNGEKPRRPSSINYQDRVGPGRASTSKILKLDAETTPREIPLAEKSFPSSPQCPKLGYLPLASQWRGPSPAMLCRYPVSPDLGLFPDISIHHEGNYTIRQVLRYELCFNLYLSLHSSRKVDNSQFWAEL
jgi:hypothetical protein